MSVPLDEVLRELKILLRPEQFSDYCPNISVDPETYQVQVDDQILDIPASDNVSLARVFLF